MLLVLALAKLFLPCYSLNNKSMKKTIKPILHFLFLFCLFIMPIIVSAQAAQSAQKPTPSNQLLNRLSNVASQGGFQTDQSIASTPIIIGTIIGAFLGFLGVTFIVILIIAGFGYMRARGNDEEIKKAIASIREAIIGLIIAMSSYAIWDFIFKNIILK